MPSGEATVIRVLKRGRAAKASTSPASASARRRSGAASRGDSTKVTCLRVCSSTVPYSMSSRPRGGRSVAAAIVQTWSTCDSSSRTIVASRRSRRVEGRRSPVRWSSVKATQPEEQKRVPAPGCRSASWASSAPAMRKLRGLRPMASRTIASGKRTIPLASSTWAPASRNSASRRDPLARMPTFHKQSQSLVDDQILLTLVQPRRALPHPFPPFVGASIAPPRLIRLSRSAPLARPEDQPRRVLAVVVDRVDGLGRSSTPCRPARFRSRSS